MVSPAAFKWDRLRLLVIAAGYEHDIEWAENIEPPTCPDAFAREVIYVICNSGMKNTVARGIFDRVMPALIEAGTCRDVFGHMGKVFAIDRIWRSREILLAGFQVNRTDEDRLAWLVTIPWIGDITKYHLAKNFGMQVAKPDVHLQRLGVTFGMEPQALCEYGARVLGLKVATVDTLLWRAAAIGRLNTRTGALL